MALLITGYTSKKDLKSAVGQRLKYRETSVLFEEYKSNGSFVVAHRPQLGVNKNGREFFATVTMSNDIIVKVQ